MQNFACDREFSIVRCLSSIVGCLNSETSVARETHRGAQAPACHTAGSGCRNGECWGRSRPRASAVVWKRGKDGVIHPRNSAQRLISDHLLAFLIIQANKLRKTLFAFKSSSIYELKIVPEVCKPPAPGWFQDKKPKAPGDTQEGSKTKRVSPALQEHLFTKPPRAGSAGRTAPTLRTHRPASGLNDNLTPKRTCICPRELHVQQAQPPAMHR